MLHLENTHEKPKKNIQSIKSSKHLDLIPKEKDIKEKEKGTVKT